MNVDLVPYCQPQFVLGDGIGMIRLVDCFGDQSAVVQAARVSYGAGTKTRSEDTALIKHLVAHWHETPFEMPVIRFHLKLPIFTERQLIRHRAASPNEESGRYSEILDEWYTPAASRLQKQSTVNKQGSAVEVIDFAEDYAASMRLECHTAYAAYQDRLAAGMSRELARINLPQAMYTSMYWQANLRMVFHMLHLRDDPHAQWEIRQYAAVMSEIVRVWCPDVHEAWLEYRHGAVTIPRSLLPFVRLAAGFEDSGLPKRILREVLGRLPRAQGASH